MASETRAQSGGGKSAVRQSAVNHSLYKTELCRSFEETRTCRYGAKCQYAHGIDELRNFSRHPKYKTEVCKTYTLQGNCPYGRRCRFIHPTTVAELPEAPVVPIRESAAAVTFDIPGTELPEELAREVLRAARDAVESDDDAAPRRGGAGDAAAGAVDDDAPTDEAATLLDEADENGASSSAAVASEPSVAQSSSERAAEEPFLAAHRAAARLSWRSDLTDESIGTMEEEEVRPRTRTASNVHHRLPVFAQLVALDAPPAGRLRTTSSPAAFMALAGAASSSSAGPSSRGVEQWPVRR